MARDLETAPAGEESPPYARVGPRAQTDGSGAFPIRTARSSRPAEGSRSGRASPALSPCFARCSRARSLTRSSTSGPTADQPRGALGPGVRPSFAAPLHLGVVILGRIWNPSPADLSPGSIAPRRSRARAGTRRRRPPAYRRAPLRRGPQHAALARSPKSSQSFPNRLVRTPPCAEWKPAVIAGRDTDLENVQALIERPSAPGLAGTCRDGRRKAPRPHPSERDRGLDARTAGKIGEMRRHSPMLTAALALSTLLVLGLLVSRWWAGPSPEREAQRYFDASAPARSCPS
jgi:hypothetical protein